MSMSVPDFLPHHAPLVVGTAELAAQTASEYTTVHLMEPPIDTARNAPTDVARARARFGFAPEELVVTVVCRMVPDLEKLQGTLEAIRATDDLANDLPVRLLVVGDGSGLPEVMVRASQVNARHRREVVVVTGGLLDPRSAYEAADVVLGMGSSALRGLAFAKPLVVQGAAGFWRLVDESTLPEFLERGWYGENGGGARELAAILGPVLRDPWRRGMLGAMGRDVVVERFSLTRASADLARIYSEAIEAPPSRTEVARGMAHASFALARFKLAMAGHRLTEQAPRALRRELSPAGGGT
jgi:glycosyltransferase involved in cell wall biosynthesis